VRITKPMVKVLAEMVDGAERYGLDLMRETGLKSGTVYPLLERLETSGLVRSRWEERDPSEAGRPRRRFYKLTATGVREAHRVLLERSPSAGVWAR
jgi:PadR family transcriptional regulator PadR